MPPLPGSGLRLGLWPRVAEHLSGGGSCPLYLHMNSRPTEATAVRYNPFSGRSAGRRVWLAAAGPQAHEATK